MEVIKKQINNILKLKLGDSRDRDILVEQYKLLIGYIQANKAHRSSLNAFYTSISSLVIGATTFVYNLNFSHYNKYLIIIINSIVGLILCLVWSSELKRILRTSQVLDLLADRVEDYMPANLFETSHKVLSHSDAPTKVEKQEINIPTLLSLCYLILLVFTIYKFYIG